MSVVELRLQDPRCENCLVVVQALNVLSRMDGVVKSKFYPLLRCEHENRHGNPPYGRKAVIMFEKSKEIPLTHYDYDEDRCAVDRGTFWQDPKAVLELKSI